MVGRVDEAVRRIREAQETGATVLDLGGLRLYELPAELAALTSLTKLRLVSNRLIDLPDWLAEFQQLTKLDIANNHFRVFPQPITALRNLTSLVVNYHKFAEIPVELGRLTRLTELRLGNAGATEVPSWLSALPLRRLGIGGGKVTRLPDWIAEMRELQELDVSENPLGRLPDWIGQLTGLTELHCQECGLTELPATISGLKLLTKLDVRYNQLAELPDWITDLPALDHLQVDGNKLTAIPPARSLTRLTFTQNKLDQVPAWIKDLSGLNELGLGGNLITELPPWLGGLATLTDLDISGCGIAALPDWLRALTSLQRLDAGSNALTEVPAWIDELSRLDSVYLGGNELHDLPPQFAALTGLAVLYLRSNRFTELPVCLAGIRKLLILNMAGNELTALPDWLAGFHQLRVLVLDGNRMTELAEVVSRLTRLTTIRAVRNQLASLPDSIGDLGDLDHLIVRGNRITGLPDSLQNLGVLRRLDLTSNSIKYLPDWMDTLPRLTELFVADNPLVSPPPEIAAAGTESVLAFLRARKEGSVAQWTSKLLVVGEGGVGKTSLVKALNRRPFDPDEPSTHGLQILDLPLRHPTRSDIEMALSAWDFGGQEIYHATHQFFLTDRSLFLLLWNSRLGWEQGRLRYWLDIIKARAPESPIVLVATHTHGRPVDLPLADLRQEYPMIVDSLVVDNQAGDGVEDLRVRLAEVAADLPLMGSEWPSTWLAAAGALRTANLKHVTPQRMWRMMSEAGLEDRMHQQFIAKALHQLGDILYYSEDPELCQTVILKPQWVNEYISKVLDSDEVDARHGLLAREHLHELWWDLEQGMRDHFLGMMDKYDLSYRVDGHPDDVSLVVERLSWNPPNYQVQWDELQGAQEIRVLYRLNTMPPGIPTWFIARSHRFSTDTHWRTGAMLKHGEQTALVRADTHRKTVELTVRGPSPAAFFSILDDGLNRTLERFPGLEIDRKVPCRCEPDCTELFNYEDLSKRLAKVPPKTTIECHQSGEQADIPDLLLGLAPSQRDTTSMSIEQISKTLTRLEDQVTANTEYNQRMFMRLQHIAQTQQETRCPSVFALVSVKKKRRYELHLYCEEPGAWHRLPEPDGVYPVHQPAEWFRRAGPYLQGMLKVLKHAAPLAGPILGIAVDQLDSQLKADCDLMKELANQMPSQLKTDDELRGMDSAVVARASTDADFRVLEAMLLELDADRVWGGLSRTTTPEGLTLYLCGEHRKAYLP
jgi:internalin A